MLNSSNLEIKDKAWRSAGESPVTQVLLLFRSTDRPLLKSNKKCETTRDKQSGNPMYVA